MVFLVILQVLIQTDAKRFFLEAINNFVFFSYSSGVFDYFSYGKL